MALTGLLDAIEVLEGWLLDLGLVCLTFSLALVFPVVSEVVVVLALLLLEAGFWLTEFVFEDLEAETDFTGSVDVGVDVTSCTGVSTFCFAGVSSLSVSLVDVDVF